MVQLCPSARPSELGSAIREARRASGLTQQELASLAGVSLGFLRDLEQGRTRWPRLATVQALSNALGLYERGYAGLVAAWELGGSQGRDHVRRGPALLVNVRILGPLAVERSGQLVDLGPVRRRTVLALLALRGRAGAQLSEIVGLLWQGGAPDGAASVIQGHVGQLRRLLNGPGADSHQPISWVDGAYRLSSVLFCRLDSYEFVSLARRGNGAVVAGAPDRACEFYGRALRMWRGEVVADIDCLRQHPLAVELSRLRLEMVLRYADAAASSGDYSGALPHLLDACRDDPLSEVLHARLITALGALGRRSEAVRAFERLRYQLGSELGIGPSELVWRAYRQAVGL